MKKDLIIGAIVFTLAWALIYQLFADMDVTKTVCFGGWCYSIGVLWGVGARNENN